MLYVLISTNKMDKHFIMIFIVQKVIWKIGLRGKLNQYGWQFHDFFYAYAAKKNPYTQSIFINIKKLLIQGNVYISP